MLHFPLFLFQFDAIVCVRELSKSICFLFCRFVNRTNCLQNLLFFFWFSLFLLSYFTQSVFPFHRNLLCMLCKVNLDVRHFYTYIRVSVYAFFVPVCLYLFCVFCELCVCLSFLFLLLPLFFYYFILCCCCCSLILYRLFAFILQWLICSLPLCFIYSTQIFRVPFFCVSNICGNKSIKCM